MSLRSKHSILGRLNLDGIYNAFLGLPPQQQTIAMIAVAVGLIIIILLPISLASGKIGKMEKKLGLSQKEMGSIVHEIEDYGRMKEQLKEMEGRIKSGYDASLSTTLESLASKAGINENI